jgi:hypothetical protein
MQKITSAATSMRIIPRLFNQIAFKSGTVNLDIGGGKYDDVTELLATKGVQNLVYDPYNRSKEHNLDVLNKTFDKADTVTVANVLNVIDDDDALYGVIVLACANTQKGGTVYFQVYEGDKTGVGKVTSKGYQRNQPTAWYVPVIRKCFKTVTLKNNIITAK